MAGEEYPVRTDLALEAKESIGSENGAVNGVDFSVEESLCGITVSTVHIRTKNAEKIMGRPRGYYITIEAPDMEEDDETYHRAIASELAKIIRKLVGVSEQELSSVSALIVGLGNRDVTPDALGPCVVDHMFITRHIIKEYGVYALGDANACRISGIVPGVMAQTGMECVEILRGVVRETHPDLVVTVDALAARSAKRLCRTIQLSDTGITPGSGIGNHRHALNRESVGVPVISLGAPTVVDAATIVGDTMADVIAELGKNKKPDNGSHFLERIEETEQFEHIKNLLSPGLNSMFVTPKDIDEAIKRLSMIIAAGINLAFSGETHETV